MKKPELDKLQRLLDYHFQLDSPLQRRQTEELLARDETAKRLDESLRRAFSPLAGWQDELVPEGLADQALKLIEQHKQAQNMAETTAAIAAQRQKSRTVSYGRVRWVLGNLRDLITVAACVMLVVMFSRPMFRQARMVSQRQSCASQMRQIGTAQAQYAADNQGFLPYQKSPPGAFWWQVAQEDSHSYSNTRNDFLLVKQGYLPLKVFICPGSPRKPRVRITLTPEMLQKRCDFPCRKHISYSSRLRLEKVRLYGDSPSRMLIMADSNPLFARFDCKKDNEVDLSANPSLLQVNSPNHSGKGQNVLYGDGRIQFHTSRYLGPSMDDMYTIKDIPCYSGRERPGGDDVFTAP
ncbi:MAG: hypothetical protein KAT56_09900 [Sedimentisphaerales bacterium]|nr:hypothetical protein [Sedimentisphaerales bacterium]